MEMKDKWRDYHGRLKIGHPYGNMGRVFPPPETRFWAKVKKTKTCWLWTAFKNKAGYGQFGFDRGLVLSHRFSWAIHRGQVPAGLFVLHKCDNPPCVRPSHLFLGNNRDNMDDMLKKGRSGRGRAKLTMSEALEVRRLAYSGLLSRVIATAYGVSQPNVSSIKNCKSWNLTNASRRSKPKPCPQ